MAHTPQYVTNVTGAGAMPSTSGAPTASCAGNGTTDDTTCLQNALNSAYAAGKPLLIPYTSAGFKITSRLVTRTSIIGVPDASGNLPTIFTTNTTQYDLGTILNIPDGASGVWITGLHLVGIWDGTQQDAAYQFNAGITIECASNITISGNLIERMRGDGIEGGSTSNFCANSANVLIANNTFRNSWRCAAMSANTFQDRWVVRDNVIEKQVNFVSAIDFEPVVAGGHVTNIEVLYNKFVMNNRSPLLVPDSGAASGKAVAGWAAIASPGGNIYVHHNYGTFGTGIGALYGSGWGYTLYSTNVEGANPP